MAFSDENLRYAKKFNSCRCLDEFEALIARLEAAEECAKHLEYMEPNCVYLKPWKQSKGAVYS